jgi:glycosyltransferase involved in cell wall biosynthesis
MCFLRKVVFAMHVTFISSYVPRKCGIATYTRDLAVETLEQGNQISIAAMENPAIPHTYDSPVAHIINQHAKKDYIAVAREINKSSTEIVHIQHEFGLFGGTDGEDILILAKALTKPLMVTLHTVLLTPSTTQKLIISELCRLSRKVVVMDKLAKDRLQSTYGLNLSDITIILHGAPLVEKTDSNKAKKQLNKSGSFIMLANNLLSRNKGMEYAIEAVAKVRNEIPNLIFLIVGETHPMVKTEEGESYRNELISQVKKLGLSKNVEFINEYVTTELLKTYLSAADVYVTPYLDPQQTTSGTLSYAIGAGKVCIATEYVYAKEMLSNNRGITVPFRDSNAIASSLLEVYKNPKMKHQFEAKIGVVSREMSWSKIAQKHTNLYKKTVDDENNIQERTKDHITSNINISYLIHLTNSIGVVQHAENTFPDLRHGYCTDDNARALIVVSQVFKKHKSEEFTRLIKVYSDFLNLAQEPNGAFHTFLDSKKSWSDTEGVTDAFGRVIWGLGFHLFTSKDHSQSRLIRSIFEKSMNQLPNITDIRAAAYTILGLYYYILAFKADTQVAEKATAHLRMLTGYLKDSFEKNRQKDWDWFEETITYDNFRLPQALFASYLITGDTEILEIATVSLKFITGCNFDKERGYFDFIGQDGWHSKARDKADYDQQPLEAAGAVDANIFASKAHNDQAYITEGILAFEWFFGNNRNHRSIYDFSSKGVSDGLTLRGINSNQGAESIICFLISSLALQENLSEHTLPLKGVVDQLLRQKHNLELFKHFSAKPAQVS